MSLRESRIDEIMQDLTEAALVEGRIPTTREMTAAFLEVVRLSDPGQPRMQLRVFPRRTRFDREAYNTTVAEAIRDLEMLFSESVDTAVRVLKGLNGDDITFKSLSYQLSVLDDAMENLLLQEPGATNYFLGVYDTFGDLSKVDQDLSTADVDLETGSVRLPIAGGVNRVNMGFLRDRTRANLAYDPDNIVGTALVPGTRFGNLFDDIIGNAWAVQVSTANAGPQAVEFTIPVTLRLNRGIVEQTKVLATAEAQLTQISRVELEPLSTGAMAADVFYSVDGKNFTRLPGYSTSVELKDKRASFVFAPTLVKHLKVRLSKAPDGTGELSSGVPGYTYTFGLKSIAAYNSGHAPSATLISRALSSEEDSTALISKVALDVEERVPEGTDIDYQIRLGDSGSWQRISPGTRSQEAPGIVEFGSSILSPRLDNKARIQTPLAVWDTKNGIDFHQIFTTGVTNIKPRSSRLYRGVNSWRRTVNLKEDVKSVHNNFVVFTLSDNRQKLYFEIEDEIADPPDSQAGATTFVDLAHNILRDESLPITPAGNNPRENPDYSVRRLIRLYTSSVAGSGGTGATIAALPQNDQAQVTLPLAQASGALEVDQYIYLAPAAPAGSAGYYRVLRVQEAATVVLIVEDKGHLLRDGSSITWSVGYQDITTSVVGTQGNRLEIDASQTLDDDDRLLVSYRTPLGPEHELLTSSVVVKHSTSDDNAPYEAGRDYIIDGEDKAIARIPEGGIQPQGDQVVVRVDFQYRVFEPDLDTYVGFLMVDSDEPKIIKLSSQIGVDGDRGERVLIDTGTAVIDVSSMLEFPPLPRGWRQVVVRSAPIKDTAGTIDTASAIYKVLNLTDANGNLIFVPNTRYFSKLSAYPKAMQETNLFKLQTGIRSTDRGWFAEQSGNVIINWDPVDVPDTIYPVVSGSATSVLDYEEFELEYRYESSEVFDVEVYFKAELSRAPEAPLGVTPELYRYNLKFSY